MRWHKTSARRNSRYLGDAREIREAEDKLPLERALRALEDVHQSLKEFTTTDSVMKNDAFASDLKTVRHRAKKLRKDAIALAALWDRTFEFKD